MIEAMHWLAQRGRDLAMWPVNLVHDGPRRVRRFSDIFSVNRSLKWRLHVLAVSIFDLLGGPEILQFFMHLGMRTSPLSESEIVAASAVLGPRALRYSDVRIAEGGVLPLIFRLNGGRAFAAWHSVQLPGTGHRHRENLGLLIHELTHVYQYEHVGSRYIGEALFVQRRMGLDCYRYGGADGLAVAHLRGWGLRMFNREAQAQIAQDYFMRRLAGKDTSAYDPFIAELRDGAC